jgi:hypothetical protein
MPESLHLDNLSLCNIKRKKRKNGCREEDAQKREERTGSGERREE